MKEGMETLRRKRQVSLKRAIEFDQGLLVKRYLVESRDFNPGFLKAVRDGISGKSRIEFC